MDRFPVPIEQEARFEILPVRLKNIQKYRSTKAEEVATISQQVFKELTHNNFIMPQGTLNPM
jgi:hypothetical protein